MRIGLISPAKSKARSYFSNDAKLRAFFSKNEHVPGFFHPNLALLTLAGLIPDDWHVEIIDERINSLTFEEEFDVVGITMMTSQAVRAYEVADQFRKQGVYVVLGGIRSPFKAIARNC